MDLTRAHSLRLEHRGSLCPACGSPLIRISTSVPVDYEVAIDAKSWDFRVLAELVGDAMWDRESSCSCPRCGWRGRVADLLGGSGS